ncbi:MAG: ComEC/Rec2 family competence protein [Paracoccaceae bacterium]
MVRDWIGRPFHWAPVCLGLGVVAWFGLKAEPGANLYVAALCLATAFAVAARWAGDGARLALIAMALVLAGGLVAALRAHAVAGPVLDFRLYGPVEGRVVAVDRSASGAVRITLDRVRLSDLPAERTPRRVRLSLHGGTAWGAEPVAGERVAATAHMSPPPGPTEPHGYDFQRAAWFDGLGAIGYARTPMVRVRPADGARIAAVRGRISAALRDRLPAREGGVAAAILVGDRAYIDPADAEALRHSNLAHLLAISGLHMGLLAGLVLQGTRGALTLYPRAFHHWPIKRIAAVLALVAATAYLLLSGGSVATRRAWIMVVVMLVAILVGRRAISLRSVALAAMIVLILTPEEITRPGFQMSFAATAALVVGFDLLRSAPRAPPWASGALGVFLTSFIAGLATAPIAAAHFGVVSHYGLLANVLTVPLMGSVVMPGAILAAVGAPVGLEGPGLWAMEWGLRWILAVARVVSDWPGAISLLPAPPPGVLATIGAGLCALLLARGWGRATCLPFLATAAFAWGTVDRPGLLVADSGMLAGVMTPDGRAVTHARGAGFVAGSWLENDGDAVDQAAAAARAPLEVRARTFALPMGEATLWLLRGTRAVEGFACAPGDIVVSGERLPPLGCDSFDVDRLRGTGALSIEATRQGPTIRTAAEAAGRRMWNDEDARRPVLALLGQTRQPFQRRPGRR